MSQSPVNLDALRQHAEQAIRRARDECRVHPDAPAGIDLTALIEELRIYQAELEIQNQELCGAQAALADSLEKYRLLFESLPLPALLIDERGFITEANTLAIYYLGLSRFQPLRRILIYRLFDTVTRARLYHLLKEHATTGPQDLADVTLRLNDGDEQVCDLHVIHLPQRGQSLLVLTDQSIRWALHHSEINRERHTLANLATANAVWDWDLLTQEIWWSQTIETLFGYANGELPPVYETWQRRLHPDDRERVEDGLRAALASGQTQWSDTYRFRRQDGTYALVEDHAIINRDAEGRAVRMSGAMRDVTERKQAEEALQAQVGLREQLAQLVAAVPGVVYSYRLRSDGTSGFPYLSSRLLDLFGVTPESAQADAERLMALIHPDDLPAFSASIAASAEALSPWHREFRIRHPDKRLLWIEAMAMPVRQANGDIVWHGFMFDISERKALEEASRRHAHMLEVAQEAAGLGCFVTDLQTGVWTSSPRLDETMGIDAAFERTIESWGGLVHPDDRQKSIAEFERAVRWNEPLQHQYRIIRPRDGEVRWVAAWGRFEYEQERPVRMIGTLKDITERKQAEERLRLSQFALEQASDAVYWIHPDSSIFFVNGAACRMLGYSQAELTAMRVTELDPGFPEPRWREHWNNIQRREHRIRLETTHRAKDGRIIPVEVSANYLLFEGREYNCAIVRDISQRKLYESRLARAADRYNTMLSTTSDGFWLVEAATGRLLDVNASACEMSGYSRNELLSMTIADLDIQHSEEDVARHCEAIARQGFELFETRHRTRDGRLIDVEVSTTYDPDTQTFVAFLRDITTRKQTERELLVLNTQLEVRVVERTAELAAQQSALKQTSARYRAIVDHSTNFIGVLDPEGRVIDANLTALRFAGIALDEVLGQPLWDTPWWRHSVTEQERLKAAVHQAGQGARIVFETTHPTLDGTLISVDFCLTPIHDETGRIVYLLPEGRDITERKEAAKRLQRSQEDLQLAIDAGQLGIWQWEIATDTLTWSDQMYVLFHVSAGTPMNYAGFLGALHPDDREPTDLEIRAALAGHRDYVMEYRVLGPDGSTPWRLALGRVYRNAEGVPEYMRGVVSDITERKQSEQAIRELNATLERKVEERTAQLAAASAAKSQFMAHMSHEMRTPMNAILGFAQILQNSPLAADQRAMTLRIGEAGESLLHLIDDILDLARIEAGQLRMDHQPFMLGAVLTRVDHLLRNTAEAKGLHFEIKTAALDGADALLGDASRLEQVLVNLLGNAIKFTGEGTVKLSVIPLSTPTASRLLRFEVEDTGIGIAPEVLDKLFQPFSQGDASITRRFGGTGLGLVISKRLVGLMGGQLSGTSRVGQGSLFWFEIPFAVASDPTTQPAAAPERTHGPELTGLRVLAVDDNRINLMVAERALQQQGASVTLAENGQQALDRLRAGPADFDVVLMDIQMPVMDGLSATRAIRKDPMLAGLPVVALSAGALAEEREAAFRAGVNDFMAKPMKIKDMKVVLKPYLKAGSEE